MLCVTKGDDIIANSLYQGTTLPPFSFSLSPRQPGVYQEDVTTPTSLKDIEASELGRRDDLTQYLYDPQPEHFRLQTMSSQLQPKGEKLP
jgi:hypothetical protein